MRPFSVARELSAATIVQLPGSLSGRGLANDSDLYRAGSKFFKASMVIAFAVIPTQASPLSMICLCATAHPIFRSKKLEGLSISTTTLPLNFCPIAGLRTSARVVYGAPAVFTTAGPGAGQL